MKLNTDGASLGNPGVAGAGGVIRDASGDWLVGFMLHLGVCSNMVAEMEAARFGLFGMRVIARLFVRCCCY